MSTESARKGVKGCNPLVGSPCGRSEQTPPDRLTSKARDYTPGAATSSRPCPAIRRLIAVAARLARRYVSRPPRQRDAAARVAPALLAAGGRDPRHRKGPRCRLVARAHPHGPHSRPHLSRWGRRPPAAAVRCPARRGRADAPARPCGAAVGAVAQLAPRCKGSGPTARLRPLQRGASCARVDLLRLGAPGLRPPLYGGGGPVPSGPPSSPAVQRRVPTGDARNARTRRSPSAQGGGIAGPWPSRCAPSRATGCAARSAAAPAILIARAIAGAGNPRPLMDAKGAG